MEGAEVVAEEVMRGMGSKESKEADYEYEEQGFAEVSMADVNFGGGDIDGKEKEWVCDSGADYHIYGDRSLFDKIEEIPSNFHVKQIKGKVPVKDWGYISLSTEKKDQESGILKLTEFCTCQA